jgi:CRP-like cAMP-binding protein
MFSSHSDDDRNGSSQFSTFVPDGTAVSGRGRHTDLSFRPSTIDAEIGRSTEVGDGDDLYAPRRNWLLRHLPEQELRSIRPHLTSVTIEGRHVLSQPNEMLRHVYFPESAVLSVISRLRHGTVEVGTVGCEGMAGLPLFLEGASYPLEVIGQVEGRAWRMDASAFRSAANASTTMHHVLLRYTSAFLIQVAQTAACNRAHLLESRCARWLLMTHDRVGGGTFMLTHEFLAFMLGVRRAGVTVAARALQQRGYIKYSRGRMTILDRAGLESASCECYRVVRDHFDRLML